MKNLIHTLILVCALFLFSGCCETFNALFKPKPILPEPMRFDPEYMVEYDFRYIP